MCIPKICFVGPKSFIAKDFLRAFFKLAILLASCPTTLPYHLHTSRELENHLHHTFSQIHNDRLVFCGIRVPAWRIQSSYTSVEKLVSNHTSSSSIYIPDSLFLSPQSPSTSAYRFPLLTHHAKMLFLHPTIQFPYSHWQLCSNQFGWMTSLLLEKISHQNLHPFSAENPSP